MFLPQDIIMTAMIVCLNAIGIIDRDALIITIPLLVIPFCFWVIVLTERFVLK